MSRDGRKERISSHITGGILTRFAGGGGGGCVWASSSVFFAA
jgi:hypothetical protein